MALTRAGALLVVLALTAGGCTSSERHSGRAKTPSSTTSSAHATARVIGHDASHFHPLGIDLGQGFRAAAYNPKTGDTWIATLRDGSGSPNGSAIGTRQMRLTRLGPDNAVKSWDMPVASELTGVGGMFVLLDTSGGVWTGWGTWLVRLDPATSTFRSVFVHTGPNSGSGGGPSTIRAGVIAGHVFYVTQAGALRVLRYDLAASRWLPPIPIHARVYGLTTMAVRNGVVYLSGIGPYASDALSPMLVAIHPDGSSNRVHMGSGAGLVVTSTGDLVSLDRSGDVSVLHASGTISVAHQAVPDVAPNLPLAADQSGNVWAIAGCSTCVLELTPSGAIRTWVFPAEVIPNPVSHMPVPANVKVTRPTTVVASPELEVVVPNRAGVLVLTRVGSMPGYSAHGGYASAYQFTA